MPVYDLRCHACEHVERDAWRKWNHYGTCPQCHSAEVKPLPSLFSTDAWGGPKYISSLDKTFSSRSDLKKELRRCGFSEAGDRVGGAREDITKKRIYSHAGQAKR